MCCVVGYIGSHESRDLVLDSLSRLEYRGYDSSGFACINVTDNRIVSAKAIGGVEKLHELLAATPINGLLGVGHTRWSTHGVVSRENAHPVFDCASTVAVVHNGIIENHHQLRDQFLAAGHFFHSQTDSEVIAHLIEQEIGEGAHIQQIMPTIIRQLHGAYAFVALMQLHPDILIAVRRRSPLCLGIGIDGIFVASDPLAFAGKAQEVVYLPDSSYALVYKDHFEVYNFAGQSMVVEKQPLQLAWAVDGKQGYDHFMLKEIFEQKRVIADTVKYMRASQHILPSQLGLSIESMKQLDQLLFIGCGSSWHAAEYGRFFFEQLARVPVHVGLASEFKHREIFTSPKAVCMDISQSGETADTLEVVRMMHGRNIPNITISNIPSSTMVRESQGFLLTQAGQEIAVASTKSFTAQVTILYWMAHYLALQKGIMTQKELDFAGEELLVVGEILENSLIQYQDIITHELAPYYAQFSHFIFLGRHVSYVLAQEACLKLKEISYIFSHAYPAGELKHGPIALIDAKTPVVIFSVLDPVVYQKLVSNAQEVKSRGGHVLAFAFEGQHELIKLADKVFVFPRINPLLAPIAMIGVMQVFVYKIAHLLGRSIDKPRNLAKSVTVE